MCFKITRGLREYFHYHGISADLERRGFGSSRLHSFASIEEMIRGYAERPSEAAVQSTLCCIRHIIVTLTSAKPSRASGDDRSPVVSITALVSHPAQASLSDK